MFLRGRVASGRQLYEQDEKRGKKQQVSSGERISPCFPHDLEHGDQRTHKPFPALEARAAFYWSQLVSGAEE